MFGMRHNMNPEKRLWNRGQCQDLVVLQYYQTQNADTCGKIFKKILVPLDYFGMVCIDRGWNPHLRKIQSSFILDSQIPLTVCMLQDPIFQERNGKTVFCPEEQWNNFNVLKS